MLIAFQQQVPDITIHMRKNDGLENYLKKKKKKNFFFLYFHIREILSHSQECGSQALFLGGSWMIREGSHVCKTNKMACVPSEDSDQPGYPPSLISVFAVRMKKAWVLSYRLSTK